jgi:hypothetical protein
MCIVAAAPGSRRQRVLMLSTLLRVGPSCTREVMQITINYYGLRVLAALFYMGSPWLGFLAGAEYGFWIGWATFISLATMGVLLHIRASRLSERR